MHKIDYRNRNNSSLMRETSPASPRMHISEVNIAPECKSKGFSGVSFFCLPCQLERSFGRSFKVTQESANSYQKLNKPLRFDSAEQRSGACGGRQIVGAKAETLPVDVIAPWAKLIQTGRGGSRQCADKVALNFKSKAAQINFCAAFSCFKETR